MATPLDPSAAANILLGGPVDLSQGTVHQQAAIDDQTGEVYATQVISGGQQLEGETEPVSAGERARRGDFAINRVSSVGELLGVMYVRGFDHGAALGVQRVGSTLYLWSGYDADLAVEGENGYARKIARYRFTDGAVLDVGDPGIDVYDPRPTFDHLTASIDTAHDQIGLRYHRDGTYYITVYRLSTFTPADFGTVIYPEQSVPVGGGTFQSWVLFGEYVYNWHGPAGGRLYFTTYSLPADAVIDEVTNNQYPDLTYREAEALFVMDQDTDTPLLVWGVATGQAGDRRMNLYAPVPPPAASITAVTVAEGVRLTVNVQDPSTVTTWQIVRQPDGDVLFNGTGADLAGAPLEFLDENPPRCSDAFYELRLVRVDGEETYRSDTVQYIPPGGCGNTLAVGQAPETIGCPDLYRARIHWRGGALVKPLQLTDELIECSWERTLNDVSEATAVFSRGAFDACCEGIADVHPWVHELTIYREVAGEGPELVWQGPIQRIRVQRETVTIEAMDVFAWLDRLVNTWMMRYVTSRPDAVGRRRGTVVYIAHNVIRLNMIESSLSVPPDYAGFYDYIRERNTGLSTVEWRKDGTTVEERPDPNDPDATIEVTVVRSRIWTEFVGEILRELAKMGLRWTTVGRCLYLRSQSSQDTRPIARLDFNDFSGDVEIIRDGVEAATRSFATNQQGDALKGRTVSASVRDSVPGNGNPYGRLDRLVPVQNDNAPEAMLLIAARNDLNGRYPAPMSISMPATAQLAPEAKVTVRKLVPGERIDVTGGDCFNLSQGFLLTDVTATWQDGAGERLAIGLATLPRYAEGGDL